VRLLPVSASELAVAEYVPSALRWVRQFAALVRSGRRVHDAHAAVAAAVLRGLLRLARARAGSAQCVLAEHAAPEAAAELLRSPTEAGLADAKIASAQPELAAVLRRAHALLGACALGAPRDSMGITPRQRAELVARVGLRLGGTRALRGLLAACAREEEARGWAALLLHEAEAEVTPMLALTLTLALALALALALTLSRRRRCAPPPSCCSPRSAPPLAARPTPSDRPRSPPSSSLRARRAAPLAHCSRCV